MTRKGFTLIEMLIVITLIAVMTAIAVPYMKVSPIRRVETAARQVLRDLELVRTRALSAKRAARVRFDVATQSYVGFMDDDANGAFAESAAETQALRSFAFREFPPDVRYGRGTAGAVPSDSGAGAVTFANSRVDFDNRGITTPLGAGGTVYLVHRDYPDAVAAVSVTGSASVKLWSYRDGAWQ